MRRVYEFGEYQLDVAAFELRRSGLRVDVQPKVLRLLGHLIECRERAVSADELMRLLWPEEIVGDGSLKRAVCGARQAIGERGGRESRIRTVHRFGYQFVGMLRESLSPSSGPTSAGAQNELVWGASVGNAELLDLLQRALLDAAASPSSILISSRAAAAGRTHTLDRLLAVARPLGVASWTVRCALHAGMDQVDAFAQLLQHAAHARGPVLIGLDDIHLADIHALRRLRTQLQALQGVRVLLIATTRSAGTAPEVEALCAKQPSYRVSLAGVSASELKSYIALATGRSPSERLVTSLHQLSSGHPLFLRLLLNIWRTEGRSTWLQLVQPLIKQQVASDVHELVAQYLALLPEHIVRLLRVAVLLGSSFSAERLATLSLTRPEQQAEALRRVSAAGLIAQDIANRDMYRFVHPVVRTAVQGQPTAAPSSWRTTSRHSFYSTQATQATLVTRFWEEMGAVNEEA